MYEARKTFDSFRPGDAIPQKVVEDQKRRGNLEDLLRSGSIVRVDGEAEEVEPETVAEREERREEEAEAEELLEEEAEELRQETFLDEDFPSYRELIAAGFTTRESIPNRVGDLLQIPGIGTSRARAIVEELRSGD